MKFARKILLIMILFLALVPMTVQAAESGTCGDAMTWTLADDGTMTISGSGDMAAFSAWNLPWKNHLDSIRKVVISEGITSISANAFANCENLAQVTLPSTLQTLPKYVFQNCTALRQIELPETLVSIEMYAMSGCTGLQSVVIPASVELISQNAFGNCTGLTSLVFAEVQINPLQRGGEMSSLRIHGWAFRNCTGLTRIDLPGHLLSINGDAFEGCLNVTGIWANTTQTLKGIEGPKFRSDSNGVLYEYDLDYDTEQWYRYALVCVPAQLSGTFSVPASVRSIQASFYGCSKLTEIRFTAKAGGIMNDRGFFGCTSLKKVTAGAGNEDGWYNDASGALLQRLDADTVHLAFVPVTNETYTVPAEVINIYSCAFTGAKLKRIDVAAGNPVYTSQNGVLYANGGKELMAYPSGATAESFTAPEQLSSIVRYAFAFARNLKSIRFVGDMVYADADAFYGISSLTCYYPEEVGMWKYYVQELNLRDSNITWVPYTQSTFAIQTQPKSQKVKAGATAVFAVEAEGDGLTYQWQYKTSSKGSWKNSTGKAATYKVSATTAKNGYYYRCRVTNTAGEELYTDMVRLYVLGVKTQPKSGTTATFQVSATGAKVTYQWQYKTSSKGSWKNSTGKAATYKVSATTAKNGYYYRCRITDDAGNSVYTDTVRLYVLGVKTQPTTQKVKTGTTATFKVSATGNNVTYQWQYKTSANGSWKNSTASSGKSAAFKVSGTTAKNGYYYRCRVTDDAGNSVYTSTVRLHVLGVKTQPTTQRVKTGATATFKVTATGSNVTYQWQYKTSANGSWKNSTASSGKSAAFKVSATTAKNGYYYRCRVTDDAGNRVYTDTVRLYVLGIKAQPKNQSVKTGTTVTFTVSATGHANVYQWQYRTSPNGTWKTVTSSSGKTATLKVSATTAKNGYQYCVKVTDSAGNSVYSNIAKLTVKR